MKVKDIEKLAKSRRMFAIACQRYVKARARDQLRRDRGQRGWNPHAITASNLFSGLRSAIKRNPEMHEVFKTETGFYIDSYYL